MGQTQYWRDDNMDNRYRNRRVRRPSDTELAQLYGENTVKEIAGMYGVSPSTVKAWIKNMSIKKG